MPETERTPTGATQRPARIRWQFDTDVPRSDFFDGFDLAKDGDLQEAIENFVYWMQAHRFHAWEGVICEEQGVSPTAEQRDAAEELLCFGPLEDEDPEDESRVLYINETPRPTEPWYEILRKIVARLLLDPFDVTASRSDVYCHGWTEVQEVVVEHGAGLSLPEDTNSALDVIAAELKHRLRLQYCFFALPASGYAGLSPDGKDNPIQWFIDDLRESREAVECFDFTLDSLLTLVRLPDDERPHLVRLMMHALELESTNQRLAVRLFGALERQVTRPANVQTGIETGHGSEACTNSTTILPAETIKQAILHPDVRIREMAVCYFANSHFADASIMPLVIEATERHGKDEAFMLVGAAVSLPQTSETIDWVIRELNDERSTTYESYTYNLERVLCAADPRLLEPREDEIAVAEHVTQGSYDIIAERLHMLSWDTDRCWWELHEHCEHCQDAVSPGEANFGHAERIVEAFARHNGCEQQVLDLLARPVDADFDTPMKWMEPLVVQLAGRMRLEAAIPSLVEKLQLDDDLLTHECEVALTRIGGDAVVRALAGAFAGGSRRFRLGATTVLEDVRADSAVQAVLELLPHESDETVGRRLRQALLGQFALAAIEPARQWLLDRGFSDFEDRGLRNDLLRRCAVMGQSIPEYDEWQETHQAEERERLAVLEKSKDDPMAALLYAMEQLTGKKSEEVMKETEERESASRRERIPAPAADAHPRIALPPSRRATDRVGRNDPCPCGSGKKYKKCCLRK